MARRIKASLFSKGDLVHIKGICVTARKFNRYHGTLISNSQIGTIGEVIAIRKDSPQYRVSWDSNRSTWLCAKDLDKLFTI